MVKKLLRMERSDVYMLLIPVGAFLVIQLITGGVMLFGKPDTGVMVSSILLPIVAALLSLLLVGSHGVMTFEQAVRMGATRRMALRNFMLVALAEMAVLFGVCAVLVCAEQLLGRFVWPALSPGVTLKNYMGVFPWWGYILTFVAPLVVGFIGGAGIQRFGGKFGWLLWGVWMLWFFVIDRLPWEQTQILTVMIPAVLIFGVLLFAWSIWSYLHAVIRR